MPNVEMKTLTIGDTTYEIVDDSARDSVGDLTELTTTAKTDLVSAINEAAESGGQVDSVNGKTGAVVLTAADVGAATTGALTDETTARTAADAQLQGQITALGNGAPIPVSTIAAMTVQTSVYLYTGTETGESTGYWYTYDSTQAKFVPRGEYGAGVIIDNTLTIPNAAAGSKAVSDALAGKAGSADVTALDTRVTAVEDAIDEIIDAPENRGGNVLHVSNNLIPEEGIMPDYNFDNTTGEAVAVASGYEVALTDYIPAKPNTSYYGLHKNRVAFYDAQKTYIDKSTQAITFTTPANCAYIRVVISRGNNDKWQYPYTHYLVEGNTRPDKVEDYGEYIPAKDMEIFGQYKSVIDRMKSLYDPTIPTKIGVYGDSNTAGLHSGATGQHYTNCWANLFCNRILSLFNQDVTIPAFGKWGTWRGGFYSGSIILESNSGAFISLDFYGSVLKIKRGTTVTGKMNVSIDGTVTVHNTVDGDFEASGLSEAKHTVIITRNDGRPMITGIVVHKYVTAENKGVSGQATSSLPINDKTYDIYLDAHGTNDRQNGSTDSVANAFVNFCKVQMMRGAEVIPIVPTPATDAFETGASAGIKMADVEAGIVKACGICNLEKVSFYQYLLDYCTLTGTALSSLFNDNLHLKETTHMLLYKYLCGVFGLGQPIDGYLV